MFSEDLDCVCVCVCVCVCSTLESGHFKKKIYLTPLVLSSLHANKRIFVFHTWALSWGMQGLVPLPEMEPGPPGLRAQS